VPERSSLSQGSVRIRRSCLYSLSPDSPLLRATIDQFFARGADKRLQLSSLHEESKYFAKLAEFVPGMNLAGTGNVAAVGAVHPNFDTMSKQDLKKLTHGRRARAPESLDPDVCLKCNQSQAACVVCEYCLQCGHTADRCSFVDVETAEAVPVLPKYVCPRCKKKSDHWAIHCKLLAKDLLSQKFRGKSSREVYAMGKQGAADRAAPASKKASLASFGKLVDGEIKKSFRKMGTAALKDPSVRSRVVAQLIRLSFRAYRRFHHTAGGCRSYDGRYHLLRYHLGEPLGIEAAAGLVKPAARRPARACWLGDQSLVPTRYYHRVPCCGLPRSAWRREWPIPGIARQ
jgi:hypothetical protein